MFANTESTYTKQFLTQMSRSLSNASFDVITPMTVPLECIAVNQHTFADTKSILSRIPKVRGFHRLERIRQFISRSDNYDICQIHVVNPQYWYLRGVLQKKCRNVVSSIWGSDFYRVSHLSRRRQEALFRISSAITFTNRNTLEEFDRYFQERYSDKLRVCRFGLAPLSELKKLRLTKAECRRSLGIPDDSFLVTIGYNANPGQQHLRVLESIRGYSGKLPGNLYILLPLTYGGPQNYKSSLKNWLEDSGLRHKLFSKFMPDREIALIRKASDVFINVQVTDQFSGSMKEHLFAENVVITGDWLPYKTLDERGVFMRKVSSVDDVGRELLHVAHNLDSLRKNCLINPDIIWELSSWEKNIQSWVGLYEGFFDNRS
ncbi:glycosyltransferase [Mesotoga sp. TolDC]|uniref:glycosyltransferase n=1 Tax=Mesotoga sp. TolDC TaxID=1389250 RepID=UPI0015E88415|nr:glycosyltransferase [Mesotoga sp. TolDC]